ncbi:hypothetical protein GCM10009836_72590 [Pseudonocardia ailaonensis]|uniref:Uncharacterized protein n=1 Tax=Pseudonocardia ailaonensis TaxID=367279 RepID=A0ABN2NPJ1_9PSEU
MIALALTGIGLLGAPVVVLTLWILALLLVGPVVAALVHTARPQDRLALRVATIATIASVVALSGVTAGVIVLLGPAALPVITAALIVAGLLARRRTDTYRRWYTLLVTPRVDLERRRPGEERSGAAERQVPTSLSSPGSSAPRRPISTAALCLAWQRSYWVLQDLPADRRCEVAAVRQSLLDEIERRDPSGFRRWLDAEPRANSDPRRHLTTDPG